MNSFKINDRLVVRNMKELTDRHKFKTVGMDEEINKGVFR